MLTSRRTWKTLYFGSESPSPSRRRATHGLMVVLAFIAYGYFTDFVVSPWGAKVGLYASAVTTSVVTLYLWYGFAVGKIPFGLTTTSRTRKAFGLLLLPLFIFGFGWVLFSRSIPDIITRLVGEPLSIYTELEKDHSYRRRQCDYQVRGDYLSFPGYICVFPSQFDRLPDKGLMSLTGSATVFGMHVTTVEAKKADKQTQTADAPVER